MRIDQNDHIPVNRVVSLKISKFLIKKLIKREYSKTKTIMERVVLQNMINEANTEAYHEINESK